MSTAKTSKEVVQPFGHLADRRIGLSAAIRHKSIAALNRMLAHTLALRDLYKKAHWQTNGATFYPLHLLFDKHANEQAELADAVAERVQFLGTMPVTRRPKVPAMVSGSSRQGFRSVIHS